MIYLLDIAECLKGRCNIGTKLVSDVLRTYKIQEGGLCQRYSKNLELLYIEEIHNYNDQFRSIKANSAIEGTSNKCYVIKTKKTKDRILTMFEPRFDRIQTRSLQQKLGDVTTSFVLSQLKDKDFVKMFACFHTPMAKMIEAYAKLRRLVIPRDIALFYKGGNMFRVVLTDLIDMIADEDMDFLLKRSDADFQIFIHPEIPNLEKIREEVKTLVLYVMYSFKMYIRNGNIIRVSKDPETVKVLSEAYVDEIESVLGIRPKVDVNAQIARRNDFVVTRQSILEEDDTDYVMLREYDTLLTGMRANHSSYFLSLNTSLDFKRRDNLHCTFDLLRFRRNVELHIDIDGGVKLNAPFEIIDVSIPKGHDYGLRKLQADASRLLKTYSFGKDLTFMAPSVEYLLMDLHDLLFKQNEYPWTDVKYIKRMMRYFLTMAVFTIVEGLDSDDNEQNLIQDIEVLAEMFMRFSHKLSERALGNDGWEKLVFKTLLGELRQLYDKIGSLDDPKEKEIEFENYETFVDNLAASFEKLSNQLVQMVVQMNAQTENYLKKRYVRLFKQGRSQVM